MKFLPLVIPNLFGKRFAPRYHRIFYCCAIPFWVDGDCSRCIQPGVDIAGAAASLITHDPAAALFYASPAADPESSK